MKKAKFVSSSFLIELGLIGAIAAACALGGYLFYPFYNLGYGLLLSVALPVLYVAKHKETWQSLGFAPVGARQIIVIVVFVLFSVGGQTIPLIIEKTVIQWNYLIIGFFPLVMTTFFEEFLFRGFFQTRFEKMFGTIPAILLSGVLFSLYHIGYPGFRKPADLLLLCAVGIGFALAYKLSKNNLMVSYFVNLPNALLTYILKHDQFPPFDGSSMIFAIVTICIVVFVLILVKIKKKIV